VFESDSISLLLLGGNGIVWISMNSNGSSIINDGSNLWLIPQIGAELQPVSIPYHQIESGRTFNRPSIVDQAWLLPATRNCMHRLSAPSATSLEPVPAIGGGVVRNLWPNPASGVVHLECEQSEKVYLYTMNGQRVYSCTAAADGRYRIETQEFAIGTCVLVTSSGRNALLHITR